jgi:hypothetical protein
MAEPEQSILLSFSYLCRQKEKDQKNKTRRLRHDPGAALLDRAWISRTHGGRKWAQREIPPSLSAMLADHADGDTSGRNQGCIKPALFCKTLQSQHRG